MLFWPQRRTHPVSGDLYWKLCCIAIHFTLDKRTSAIGQHGTILVLIFFQSPGCCSGVNNATFSQQKMYRALGAAGTFTRFCVVFNGTGHLQYMQHEIKVFTQFLLLRIRMSQVASDTAGNVNGDGWWEWIQHEFYIKLLYIQALEVCPETASEHLI